MDRFRKLLGKKKTEQDARRRASHAGFEAPRFDDLRKRRQSLPVRRHVRFIFLSSGPQPKTLAKRVDGARDVNSENRIQIYTVC